MGSILAYCDDHDLSAIQCFYYAVITMTTIGYGDISPGTTAGKGVGIVYLLFGCATVAQVLGGIAGVYIEAKQVSERRKRRIETRHERVNEHATSEARGNLNAAIRGAKL